MLTADGKLTVSSATADIGTGTYTIMTQIAAETLGLPIEDVTFKLGDSSLPEAPVEGGSFTASSVGSAVKAACEEVREKLFELARKVDGSPLADADARRRRVRRRPDPPARATRRGPSPSPRRCGSGEVDVIEEEASAGRRASRTSYSRYTHSAIFAEVEVDEDFGTVRVTRVVSAVAGGPHPQPEDGPEPGHRRRRLGHRHGPGGGERARPQRSAGS